MGQKKKAKRFDKKVKAEANRTLETLYAQYDKMAAPSRSYYDSQITRVQQDVVAQKKDANQNLLMLQKQEDQKQNLVEGQAARGYQDFISSTQEQMDQSREQAAIEASEARAAGAGDIFSMMMQEGQGGLAGTGARSRKMLGERAKVTMAKVNLGLKQSLESATQAIEGKDIQRMQDIEGGRLSMQQSKDTAAQTYTQTTAQLDRQLVNETAKLTNEKGQALDRMRQEAMGVISGVRGQFQHSHSGYSPTRKGSGEPHKTMDDIDDKYGIEGNLGGG